MMIDTTLGEWEQENSAKLKAQTPTTPGYYWGYRRISGNPLDNSATYDWCMVEVYCYCDFFDGPQHDSGCRLHVQERDIDHDLSEYLSFSPEIKRPVSKRD